MEESFNVEEILREFQALPVVEKLETYLSRWNRTSPIIITEIEKHRSEIEKKLGTINGIVWLKENLSPEQLYNFSKVNKEASIIIDYDILNKRVEHIGVLEELVCSSSNSASLWPVRFKNKEEFKFKGRIIVFSNYTRKQISKKESLKYIDRDCIKI